MFLINFISCTVKNLLVFNKLLKICVRYSVIIIVQHPVIVVSIIIIFFSIFGLIMTLIETSNVKKKTLLNENYQKLTVYANIFFALSFIGHISTFAIQIISKIIQHSS